MKRQKNKLEITMANTKPVNKKRNPVKPDDKKGKGPAWK
jgi:hypothetical protein